VERGINTPLTSSCGRLFDAVSAILGICHRVDYEAQAAIELEMASTFKLQGSGFKIQDSYPFRLDFVAEEEGEGGVERLPDMGGKYVLGLEGVLNGVLADRREGKPVEEIGLRFHITVARMIVETCRRIAEHTGITTVALSGGCFQNRLLLGLVVPWLREAGFRVLLQQRVPCNDGGISLGQAVIAHLKNLSS